MKKIFAMLVAVSLALAMSVSVFADMGPKPSVQIAFTDMPGETFYATLLSRSAVSGPYSANVGGWSGDYDGGDCDEEVLAAFEGYEDADGFYFLRVYWKSSETGVLNWSYLSPTTYKILLYFPDSGEFCVSPIYERYAFDSSYTVSLAELSGGVISASRSYDYAQAAGDFFMRCIVTIAIELIVAMMFGYREKRLLTLIAAANVVTQVILNLVLSYYVYMYSAAGISALIGGGLYILMEILVFVTEALVYVRLMPPRAGRELSRRRIWLYSLAANAASCFAGIVVTF